MTVNCKHCEVEINPDFNACYKCGLWQDREYQIVKQPDRITELEEAIEVMYKNGLKDHVLTKAAREYLLLLKDIADGVVKVVPVNPTPGMQYSGSFLGFGDLATYRTYKTMLASSPDYFLTKTEE